MPEMVYFGEFLKPEACGQTVLPERSVLIGQKLIENAKIIKFKCDFKSNFQTLCTKRETLFVLTIFLKLNKSIWNHSENIYSSL